MKTTICVLAAALSMGLAGCSDKPNYEFSGNIDGNKVIYEVPWRGREKLTITDDEMTRTYFIRNRKYGDDTSEFLDKSIDLNKFCVTKAGKEEECFERNLDDGVTYPNAFKQANGQAWYWINRILEVKRANINDFVKDKVVK